MEQQDGHILSIENKKKISATQIESVNSFSSTQIVLQYHGGKIVVNGSDMKITAFSKQTGQFVAMGEIDGVKYSRSGVGLKGIFK